MKFWKVILLGGTTVFGYLIMYLVKVDNTEARVRVLEDRSIHTSAEINQFKNNLSQDIGEIKGQNKIIIDLLKKELDRK